MLEAGSKPREPFADRLRDRRGRDDMPEQRLVRRHRRPAWRGIGRSEQHRRPLHRRRHPGGDQRRGLAVDAAGSVGEHLDHPERASEESGSIGPGTICSLGDTDKAGGVAAPGQRITNRPAERTGFARDRREDEKHCGETEQPKDPGPSGRRHRKAIRVAPQPRPARQVVEARHLNRTRGSRLPSTSAIAAASRGRHRGTAGRSPRRRTTASARRASG